LSDAAGIIGSGSEVLGFDDEMSSDHHWGPRTMLFLSVDELKSYHKLWREDWKMEIGSSYLETKTLPAAYISQEVFLISGPVFGVQLTKETLSYII